MELNGLAFVLKCTDGEDNNCNITAEFVRDGKEITYSDVSIQDKYNFCMACKKLAVVLANIILIDGKDKEGK